MYSEYRDKASHKDIERNRVMRRMGKFEYKKSRAYRVLQDFYGKKRSKAELLSMAMVICIDHPELKLDREAKRRKSVLYKWYDDNFDVIYPILKNFIFGDSNQDRYIDIDNADEK